MSERQIRRLRMAVLVLLLIVVFAAFAAPAVVIQYNQQIATHTELTVACTAARANIEQLTALNEIADQLGIPHTFTVPKEPAACDGL
jgi:hypothetical protein